MQEALHPQHPEKSFLVALAELVPALGLAGAQRPEVLGEAILAAQRGAPPAYVSKLLSSLCPPDIEMFANVVSSNLPNDEPVFSELDHVLDASPERSSPLRVGQDVLLLNNNTDLVPARRGVVAGHDQMFGSERDEASLHRYFRWVPVN